MTSFPLIPQNHGGPDLTDSEDKALEYSQSESNDHSRDDESVSDPLASLMQRVDQFQSRLVQSIPNSGFDSKYSEGMGESRSANELQRAAPYEDGGHSTIEASPSPPRSPKEVLERLEQTLRRTDEQLSTLENLLRTACDYKAQIDHWCREMESFGMSLGEMSAVESKRIRELIERLQKRHQKTEELGARIDLGEELSSSIKQRARQMKEQYTALAALLLERYREIQHRNAADPRIELRLKALVQIGDLVARLLREDPRIIFTLGEKTQKGLLELRKACSTLALDLLEEPPPPTPADTMDTGPPADLDPAFLNHLADDLMRQSPLPALFMEPEMLYLQQLQKSLTSAIIDYRERLEIHRRRCCPEPAGFEKRFEDFVQSTLIQRIVEPMEEEVQTNPKNAHHIKQILQRILDLAQIPRQPSLIPLGLEPERESSI